MAHTAVRVGYYQLKTTTMNTKGHWCSLSTWARRITAVFCFLAGMAATAMANDTQIKIWKKQGGTVSYALSAKPRITYSGNLLQLNTNGVSVTYPVADVERITFEAVTNSIEGITQPQQGHCLISVTAEGINIEGATPNEPVVLYTIDGRLLRNFRTDSRGTLTIKLTKEAAFLHSGQHIYIVRVGQSTLKVTRP